MSDPGTIVISLGPLSDYLKPILDQAVPPIATAIVGIGVYYLRKWANIKISDSDAAQIQKAAADAAAGMVAKAEDNLAHATVTTKDPRVGAAADFITDHYKDTLKGLGVTQDDVAHQIVSEVGKLQATMTTAPVAKNPPAPQPAALPAGVVTVLALILSAGVLLGAGGHAEATNLGNPPGRFPGASSSTATGSAQAIGAGGLVSLEAVMNGLADDKTKADVIAQLQTINWISSQPKADPTNPGAAPVAFDPYAQLCIPPLIDFLGTIKGNSGIPQPPKGMATGTIVDLYIVARATPIVAYDALARVKANGLPPSVEAGCGLFLQKARNLPFKLSADAPTNILSFLNTLISRVTGL